MAMDTPSKVGIKSTNLLAMYLRIILVFYIEYGRSHERPYCLARVL